MEVRGPERHRPWALSKVSCQEVLLVEFNSGDLETIVKKAAGGCRSLKEAEDLLSRLAHEFYVRLGVSR